VCVIRGSFESGIGKRRNVVAGFKPVAYSP
jgi:hypothetical protein